MKKLFLIILLSLLVVAISMAGQKAMLGWDANTESDLAGYRIYQSDTSGTNYTLIADIPCKANNTSCTKYQLNDIPDGDWFWVATAYDSSGNESGYSNEVTLSVDLPPAKPTGCSVRMIP